MDRNPQYADWFRDQEVGPALRGLHGAFAWTYLDWIHPDRYGRSYRASREPRRNPIGELTFPEPKELNKNISVKYYEVFLVLLFYSLFCLFV